MLKLDIPNDIFERMLQQAKAEAPLEACGILAGQNEQVEKFYIMTNADQSNEHFMMVPEEQFEVVKDIRASPVSPSPVKVRRFFSALIFT